MERRVRPQLPDRAKLSRRRVEEHRRTNDAAPEGVEASAVEVRAHVLLVPNLAERGLCPDASGLVGPHRRAAGSGDEKSRGCKRLVAQHPGRHSEARPSRQEPVLRIPVRGAGGEAGGLPVGGARHDPAAESLEVPPALGEVGGEPVEQPGVAGPLPLRAEVLSRLDQADAEKPLPDAVDHDARRERIVPVDQPFCEAQSVSHGVLSHRGQVRRHGRGHLLAPLVILALLEHEGLAAFCGRQVFHHHDFGLPLDADRDHRRLLRVPAAAVDGRLVEEREEPVVVAPRQRVEFVVVAARAVERQAEPDGSDGLELVEDVLDPVLLGDAAPLAVDHVVPAEPGGQLALGGGLSALEVAGELEHGKPVEGHVPVQGPDGPVPPRPHRPVLVLLVAVGVGVARRVKPRPGHPLAERRRGKEAVDDPLEGAGGRIGQEGVHLIGRGRQADQVQRDPADQPLPARFRGRRELLQAEPLEDEGVDGVPLHAIRSRRRRPRDRLERPVDAPAGAGVDPSAENPDLAGRERQLRLRRRHPLGSVGMRDALPQLAFRPLPRNDHVSSAEAVLRVQPKLRFARVSVGAVTLETAVREDGPHVAGEIDLIRGGQGGGERQEQSGHPGVNYIPARVASHLPLRAPAVIESTR